LTVWIQILFGADHDGTCHLAAAGTTTTKTMTKSEEEYDNLKGKFP